MSEVRQFVKERPKNSAFLLIVLAILCVYLVKSYYNAPRRPSSDVEFSSGQPYQFGSIGARLVYGLKVDINSATAQELELLPGIGPVLAARIVEERFRANGFNSIKELDRVKGLSPKRLKALSPYITAGGPADK